MPKTIILPFVLYGFEMWSFALKEEHKLQLFTNRVFRKMLGLTNNQVNV
jgi:hypothetical protein